MTFERPYLLFLLIVPLLIAIAAPRSTGVPVAAPVSPGALRTNRGLAFLLAIPAVIPAALLALLVVFWAHPIRFEQSNQKVPRNLTNIQFSLNVSDTMLAAPFGTHCRYCTAAAAMGEFARGREGDAFGLTLFGAFPIIWVPLSDDVSALYRAAQLCYPDHMPDMVRRYPDTQAGLRQCIDQLKLRRGSGERMIILLTDCEDSALAPHVNELAELMIEESITLRVLLFQNPGGAPELAKLAQRTRNGGVSDCSSAQELGEVFRVIDNMKKIEYETASPLKVPYTWPWIVTGASLCAFYLASLFGIRFTPW